MNSFRNEELERMKATQEAGMMDLCIFMRYSETPDSINHPTPTWTDDATTTICGLDPTGGNEQRGNNRTMVRWDAKLRVPLGTTFDLRDRVRIILRFGKPCTAITYEVSGPADVGPSGMVVPLMKVEPSE